MDLPSFQPIPINFQKQPSGPTVHPRVSSVDSPWWLFLHCWSYPDNLYQIQNKLCTNLTFHPPVLKGHFGFRPGHQQTQQTTGRFRAKDLLVMRAIIAPKKQFHFLGRVELAMVGHADSPINSVFCGFEGLSKIPSLVIFGRFEILVLLVPATIVPHPLISLEFRQGQHVQDTTEDISLRFLECEGCSSFFIVETPFHGRNKQPGPGMMSFGIYISADPGRRKGERARE